MKQTHMIEIVEIIRKALSENQARLENLWSNAEGYTADIIDFDGRKYNLTITHDFVAQRKRDQCTGAM